jgi:hypothetical protein
LTDITYIKKKYRDVSEDGGLDEESLATINMHANSHTQTYGLTVALTAGHNAGTLLLARSNVAENLVELDLVNNGALVAFGVWDY